jgi:hypothetical protein
VEMGFCRPAAAAMQCDVMRGLVLGNECAVERDVPSATRL